MNYITVREAAEEWQISERTVRYYCDQGRIDGAILVGGTWIIPSDAPRPTEEKKADAKLTLLAKKIVYQRNKNDHFGIYEYIQINLAYSSNRMASNRLTRKQVEEVFRTNKVATAFEPMKVDDLIEVVNHFACVRYVVDNIATPLTPSFIRQLHEQMTYGTYGNRKGKLHVGAFRNTADKIGVAPKKTNRILTDTLKVYEKHSANLDAILDLHARFEWIRPFEDYNGRVGRIIMLKECLRHDVTPFIIDDKRRSEYNRRIAQWFDNPEPLKSVVLKAQDRFEAQLELCRLMQYRRPSEK